MQIRTIGAAALIALVLVTSVACTAADYQAYTGGNDPDPSAAAADLSQERANAILSYVEAERTQLPAIQAIFPGLYSEVRAEATMEDQDGSRGIPAGEYAVAHFYYTYSNNEDWSSTLANLDALRGTVDQFCEDTVFPAMEAAGVTLPMGVTFNYSDESSEFGPMWTHACSKW